MIQGNPMAQIMDGDPDPGDALIDRQNERRTRCENIRISLLLPLLAAALLVNGWSVPQCRADTNPQAIRVGYEKNFPPYSFVDAQGRPAGFGVDLLNTVAQTMGLSAEWSNGTWDDMWNGLVTGQLDALPIVAKTSGRMELIDFSLAHTETFDAFFVREGDPPIPDFAAAQGKSIVAMRSDAAHHELSEHHFAGDLVLVDSIPEGLALVSSGRHDAYLGSVLICSLVIQEHGIPGLKAGKPIPDYKRVFSFGVKKGARELREKLNQGLLIIKANGEYDRIYHKWLTIEDPVLRYRTFLIAAVPTAAALVLIAGLVLGLRRKMVLRRNAELARNNEQLEREITERKRTEDELRSREEQYRQLYDNMGDGVAIYEAVDDAQDFVFVGINNAGESLSKVRLEDVIGKRLTEVFPAVKDLGLLDVLRRVWRTGKPELLPQGTYKDNRIEQSVENYAYKLPNGQVVTIYKDVTKRMQAEEALRESETMFRQILDSVPQSLFWKDVNSVFLGCNQAFAQALGLSGPEQLVGKTDFDFPIPRVEAEAYRADDAEVIASKIPKIHIQEPLQLADGRRLWLDTSKIPLLDANQNIRGILGVYDDVTERKRVDDALRKRLEMEQVLAGVSGRLIGLRFEEMEKDLPPLLGIIAQAIGADVGGLCSLGTDGPLSLATWSADGEPAAEDTFLQGAEPQAWLLSRLRNFENFIIRKAEDLPPEAKAERYCLAGSGIQSLLAVPLMKLDALTGSLVFTTVREPRDWSQEDVSLAESFARILATGIEAARLERALRYNEQRYFDLIDNLSEGLWSIDADKKITFVNKSMAEMLGYGPEEMLGEDPRTYMTGEEARGFDERRKDRMMGKSGKYTSEYLHRDGHRVFVSVSATPIRDEQNNIVGAMALVSDLSKERMLQLQLLQAQRLESIGQLAAGIAHEVNTPTQYIDNNIQFLRSAFDSLQAVRQEENMLLREAKEVPALADAVRRVEDARAERQTDSLLAEIPDAFDDTADGLKRITTIVDSVKRFAHPGQEAFQAADINDALCSTIVVARGEWKYVAEMVTDLDPDLPPVPCVLADINQVMLNLIINAAHAIDAAPGRAPDAKGVITVRTRVEDRWVVIEVQDTGTGIPTAFRPRIFDPFFTTKEVGKGTGQGLAIARTVVVEKHGGSIAFETEEGKGTTFFVRLPLEQPQEKPE